MKGNPKVIEELNKALKEELTAINQYFLHAEMCEKLGIPQALRVHQEAVHWRDEACGKADGAHSLSRRHALDAAAQCEDRENGEGDDRKRSCAGSRRRQGIQRRGCRCSG